MIKSQTFDLSEYRIQEESFKRLEEEFGPWDMDWFASDRSKRLDRFASRFWTDGSEATDASDVGPRLYRLRY